MRKSTLGVLAVAVLGIAAVARAENPPGDSTPKSSSTTSDADRAFAAEADFGPIRTLPFQAGGRRKPLDTWARERVFFVSEERRLRGEDPVFTALKWALEPERSIEAKTMLVRFLELTKAFTGEDNVGKCFVSAKEVDTNPAFKKIKQTQVDWSKQRGHSPLEKAVMELTHRSMTLQSMPEELTFVPVSDDPTVKWASVPELATLFPDGRFKPLEDDWKTFVAAFRARDAKGFNEASKKLVERLNGYDFRVYPETSLISLEYSYNRFRPELVAAWLYALATLAFLLSRGASFFQKADQAPSGLARVSRLAGVATISIAVLIHAFGLFARSYIAQRAPVASFYETIIFISAVCTFMAAGFELYRPTAVAGLWGSLLGALALLLGQSVPAYVETQAIAPLVPVLRSYWLNIHVTLMLASYGAVALAFGVGLDYGATWLFYKGPDRDEKLRRMDDFNYRVIQVGFTLLTVGTGLGAIWANQSWGRYWGWDPKETGAFITWMIYAGYLHARFMGWVKGIWSTVWNVAGFCGVLFTYVVVSFFLKGLHSYL